MNPMALIDNGSHPMPVEVAIVLWAIIVGIATYVLARAFLGRRGEKRSLGWRRRGRDE